MWDDIRIMCLRFVSAVLIAAGAVFGLAAGGSVLQLAEDRQPTEDYASALVVDTWTDIEAKLESDHIRYYEAGIIEDDYDQDHQ